MTSLSWHQVKDPEDRRKVVYWRLGTGAAREWVGAVSQKPEGWRALRYEYPDGQRNVRVTELGYYESKHQAQRVVEDANRRAGGNPDSHEWLGMDR